MTSHQGMPRCPLSSTLCFVHEADFQYTRQLYASLYRIFFDRCFLRIRAEGSSLLDCQEPDALQIGKVTAHPLQERAIAEFVSAVSLSSHLPRLFSCLRPKAWYIWSKRSSHRSCSRILRVHPWPWDRRPRRISYSANMPEHLATAEQQARAARVMRGNRQANRLSSR